MKDVRKEFLEFIQNSTYPCLGAKAALNKNLLTLCICADINSSQDDLLILSLIYKFIEQWKIQRELFQSFAVIFKNTLLFSEVEFETLLWARLQALHNLDNQRYCWNEGVSSDVTDPKFSFCLGNVGFFIIGLHPNSSRKARQFRYPTLIFNLHEQFQIMRRMGAFDAIKDKIRKRDEFFSGSINPMLDDFGSYSEALQYSGRITSKSYKCPFVKKKLERLEPIAS